MTNRNSVSIAIIGFGEVGTTLSRGYVAAPGYEVAAYDILMRDPAARPALVERARAIGVRLCETAAEAAAGAHVVISAVTATSAYAVAAEAGGYMKPGQIFMDLNSVSPQTKRKDAEAVEASGADYVESAVMAPIGGPGLKTPMVLGGRRAADLKALLDPAGMRLTVGVAEIGHASALKMCRSVMVKGMEALIVEAFTAARVYGVEDGVVQSLRESYPGLDWEDLVGYALDRVIVHGRRRAAEMRESAETVADTGLVALMTTAIAGRIDGVADLVVAHPDLKSAKQENWRDTLDVFAQHWKLHGPEA